MIGKINAENLQKQDPFVFDEIFVKNTYDLSPEDLKDADVIDIGANKGFFTIFAVANGARSVLAVEPGRKQINQLMKNTEGMFNVNLQPYAVSNISHQIVYLTDEDGSSKINDHDGEFVNTVTLEEIVSSIRPSAKDLILKMDIEGSEFPVILNADNNLLRKFKTICLEIHDEKRKDEIIKKLESAGFHGKFINALYTATGPLGVETWKFSVRMDKDIEIPSVLTFEDYKVLCSISTKDRYDTTLPLCLLSVINQTRKPNKIIIFDDGEHKDLRNIEVYKTLFNLMDINQIEWEVLFGKRLGQHFNHQMANSLVKFDFIWRIDDDEIANPDVLAQLLSCMTKDVGAVGGSVVLPTKEMYVQTDGKNKILELFHKPNLQWSIGEGVVEVEHLYSSFLYRPGIVQYNLNLSPVAHREETLFTHELFRKGYKLLVNRDAVTFHFRQETGGIRSHQQEWFYKHDEKVFLEQMEKWGYKIISLNVGLGDHFAFSNLIPNLLEKYKYLIIGCCYPDVFKNLDDRVILLPVGITEKITDEHIYKYMWDNWWAGANLVDAFAQLYKVDTPKNRHIMLSHEMPEKCSILISPYSRLLRSGAENPKNYPYWKELVALLEADGHHIIQIGERHEKQVTKDFRAGLNMNDIKILVHETNFWISVDNFLPHLAWTISDKPGVAIFGKSDPLIFGYPENLNILKSRDILRKFQFDIWEREYFDASDFYDAQTVYTKIKEWIANKCQVE